MLVIGSINQQLTTNNQQTMNIRILTIVIIVFVVGCSPKNDESTKELVTPVKLKKEDFVKAIGEIQVKMLSSEKIDTSIATKAIKVYADFAFKFPEDSIVPDYLFKAAEIASSIRSYHSAIVYYQTILDKYPDFKLVTESLYLQGYLYDNFINDEAKAKEIYEKVIAKYPKHKLAEDSKFAIENLGKSDMELIEQFKKKNKAL